MSIFKGRVKRQGFEIFSCKLQNVFLNIAQVF